MGNSSERGRWFSIQNPGEWHEYVFDLSKTPYWNGENIVGWRLDPIGSGPAGAEIEIDYIYAN